MNPGLGQGFVRFGTVAHDILLYLHEHGPARYTDLFEELGHSRGVSANLRRLRKFGFIYKYDVSPLKETGERTQAVWSLSMPPGYRVRRMRDYKPLTPAERTKRYRERKKKRVSSIWEFRP